MSADDVTLPDLGWYHGYLRREPAEQLLKGKRPGSFLIRASDRDRDASEYYENVPSNFVLSYMSARGVLHFRISQICGEYFVGGRRFESLTSLVEFYTLRCDLQRGGERLRFPVAPLDGRSPKGVFLCSPLGTYEASNSPNLLLISRPRRVITTLTYRKQDDSDELSFRKGDVLVFEQELANGWFWAANLASGERGCVHADFCVDDCPENLPYYHSDRDAAIQRLTCAGVGGYLLVPSQSTVDDYCLLVFTVDKIRKFKIGKLRVESGDSIEPATRESYRYLIGNRQFERIDDIVSRYRKSDALFEGCALEFPVPREDVPTQSDAQDGNYHVVAASRLDDDTVYGEIIGTRRPAGASFLYAAARGGSQIALFSRKPDKSKRWKRVVLALNVAERRLLYFDNAKRVRPKAVIDLQYASLYSVHSSLYSRGLTFQLTVRPLGGAPSDAVLYVLSALTDSDDDPALGALLQDPAVANLLSSRGPPTPTPTPSATAAEKYETWISLLKDACCNTQPRHASRPLHAARRHASHMHTPLTQTSSTPGSGNGSAATTLTRGTAHQSLPHSATQSPMHVGDAHVHSPVRGGAGGGANGTQSHPNSVHSSPSGQPHHAELRRFRTLDIHIASAARLPLKVFRDGSVYCVVSFLVSPNAQTDSNTATLASSLAAVQSSGNSNSNSGSGSLSLSLNVAGFLSEKFSGSEKLRSALKRSAAFVKVAKTGITDCTTATWSEDLHLDEVPNDVVAVCLSLASTSRAGKKEKEKPFADGDAASLCLVRALRDAAASDWSSHAHAEWAPLQPLSVTLAAFYADSDEADRSTAALSAPTTPTCVPYSHANLVGATDMDCTGSLATGLAAAAAASELPANASSSADYSEVQQRCAASQSGYQLASNPNPNPNPNPRPAASNSCHHDGPAIRVRIRFVHEVIMPIGDYVSLFELLGQDDFAAVNQLAKVVDVVDRPALSRALLNVFPQRGDAGRLLICVLRHEIYSTDVEFATLFRGTSLATSLMDDFLRENAASFCERALKSTVTRVCELRRAVELNVERSAERDANLAELSEILRALLDDIHEAARSCMPRAVRQALRGLHELVLRRFEKDAESAAAVRVRAVSAFVFLRFLCIALLDPRRFALTEAAPSESAQRTLKLIAKALQNLANQVEFGHKEAFMECLNRFVADQKPRMLRILEELTADTGSGADEAPASAETCFTGSLSRELARIHQIAHTHLEQLRREAAAKKLVTVIELLANKRARYLRDLNPTAAT